MMNRSVVIAGSNKKDTMELCASINVYTITLRPLTCCRSPAGLTRSFP